ncbi:MAG: hypothetical protein V4555_21825 [Acidobacteriota bacterium]
MSVAIISVREIAALVGAEAREDERGFVRVAGYGDAGPDAVVFAQDEVALAKALASAAGLVLAPVKLAGEDARLLGVKHPKHAFAVVARWFEQFASAEIHPAAVIAEGASVGARTAVGAGTVIEAGAVVGAGCRIDANVTVYGCAVIGDRVVLQAGAVIGAMLGVAVQLALPPMGAMCGFRSRGGW